MYPLLFRILWQFYPSLWACALFWFVIFYPEFCRIREGSVNWWTVPIFTGAAMNATVTLANNGRMPVLGNHAPMSIWVVGTGKHLLFLCDRFWGFSAGDFFVISGLIVLVIHSIWTRKNSLNSVKLDAAQDS